MNIEKIKQIQRILGVVDDGIWGPITQAALVDVLNPATAEWHEGTASSFADPADIRAFKRCKKTGKTDKQCFKVGDNGVGKWGTDTTINLPMVALPPEDWQHLAHPQGTKVIVEANGRTITATLEDTMPRKASIKNKAIIDLNATACAMLGLTPPMMAEARWRWA